MLLVGRDITKIEVYRRDAFRRHADGEMPLEGNVGRGEVKTKGKLRD